LAVIKATKFEIRRSNVEESKSRRVEMSESQKVFELL